MGCENEGEQITGVLTMIEDQAVLPFSSSVLGMTVAVAKVDRTACDGIVAGRARNQTRSLWAASQAFAAAAERSLTPNFS